MVQVALLGVLTLLLGTGSPLEMRSIVDGHLGRYFVGISDCHAYQQQADTNKKQIVLTSSEIESRIPANEIVLSWNLASPTGTGIEVEARAKHNGRWTKYYHMGHWSKEVGVFPRESVKGQKDLNGDVETDTLTLKQNASSVQVRMTLHYTDENQKPTLKFLGLSFTDTHAPHLSALPANKKVWGKEIPVPAKWQTGWEGARGWCSPTSTAMTLAFWAERLKRPELDFAVPDAARACFDRVYDGTGNWAFNTAFAGSFPGIRAYVTRFGDIRELENWIEVGLPVVVSCSLDLLRSLHRANDPGHLLVLIGFTETGDVILNDPAYHPEKNEVARHVYSRANFLKAWKRSNNTVYLIYPEGSSLPEDPSEHWESPQK